MKHESFNFWQHLPFTDKVLPQSHSSWQYPYEVMVILYYSLRLANSEALGISTPRIGLLDPPSAYHGKETNGLCFCQPSLCLSTFQASCPGMSSFFYFSRSQLISLCFYLGVCANINIFFCICALCKFLMTWSNLQLSTLMSAEIQYVPLLPTTHTHIHTKNNNNKTF